MPTKKYKPLVGKMFYIIWIPTSIMMIVATILSFAAPIALIILLATDVFTFYFLVSSLVGYVELREGEVFVKCGFIQKVTIPYDKIRDITKEHKFYADSMISIKNALDHVNIKYNKFDIISVSVKDNDGLVEVLKSHIR